jgi:DNA-binding LytR/AlgR family response regulator
MKVLIADDEPIARGVLREHLEEIPGVTIVGEASDGLRAAEQIARLHPDVVLLDIQMPNMDGFAVARSLEGSHRTKVIFVTAYATHAVDAFQIGVADYLVKPVRRERLEQALRRVVPSAPTTDASRPEAPRKIVGRRGQDYHMLATAEVIAFQTDGETVSILSTHGRFTANQTLRQLAGKLPSPPFRRIHRQTIVNTDHIRKISPLTSKRWLLTLSAGIEAIVSKRMASVIRGETQW